MGGVGGEGEVEDERGAEGWGKWRKEWMGGGERKRGLSVIEGRGEGE